MVKTQILLALGCFLLSGCNSVRKNPEAVAQSVARGIPLQSTPARVLNYLDGQKIRHSPYKRDAIEAGIPHDTSKWELVYTSYGIVFRFDDHNRLIATEVHPRYTGPQGKLLSYSAFPHPEQNRAVAGFVCPQRPQAVSVPGCAAGGIFSITFTGWPQPGIGIPSMAAIPAA